MPHLVAQVPQDVRPIEALHVAPIFLVDRRELRPREIEGDRDGDCLERHAPFGGEVETRLQAGESYASELLLELLENGLEPSVLDGEPQIADRGRPETGFAKGAQRGRHGSPEGRARSRTRQTYIEADRRTGGQADRRTGGQAVRRTGGQADRR